MSQTEVARLCAGARELGVTVSASQADALLAYLDLVYRWNRSAGLTRIAREAALRLHLLDSLAISPFLGDAASVADLGSGAGLPGLPLALLHEQRSFTLVESTRKKCSFLLEAVRVLGLSNVSVRQSDVAELVRKSECFDLVLSRAFRPPLEFLGIAAGLIGARGRILLMTARPEPDLESGIERAGFRIVTDRGFVLPEGPERRRVLVVCRQTCPDI